MLGAEVAGRADRPALVPRLGHDLRCGDLLSFTVYFVAAALFGVAADTHDFEKHATNYVPGCVFNQPGLADGVAAASSLIAGPACSGLVSNPRRVRPFRSTMAPMGRIIIVVALATALLTAPSAAAEPQCMPYLWYSACHDKVTDRWQVCNFNGDGQCFNEPAPFAPSPFEAIR